MAVVSVKQARAGRSGDSGSDFNRSYTVVWTVIVDSRYDSVATIANDPRLPGRYVPYVGYENTDDPDALCTQLQVEQDGDDWHRWKATATFETNFTNDENKPQEDPIDDPIVRWVEVEFERRKVTKEWDGTDIRNTVGQVIDGIERDFAVGVYCFEQNLPTITPYIKSHNNTVNSTQFFDLLPGEGLIRISVGKPEYRNGILFYKHTYRVRINPQKWTVKPANKATGIKNEVTGELITVDRLGDPYGEIYLDENSKIIKTGLGVPIYFLPEKQVYEPKDWSVFGLEP